MFEEKPNVVGWEMKGAFLLAGLGLLASVLLDIQRLRSDPGIGHLKMVLHLGSDFLSAAIAACGIWVALVGRMPQRKIGPDRID